MPTAEPLDKQLALARRELLELSTANRLLNTKRNTTTGAAIEIKDESTAEIYRMLVEEGAVMRFEEGELVDAEDEPEAPASDESASEPAKKAQRRATKKKKLVRATDQTVDLKDDILHTILDPEELDRRLNRLVTDGSAIMQDQGVNVLYLALGFLRWQEANFPDIQRHAPLLLIPVKLERGRGGTRYSLSFNSDQEINTNFTLKTRLLSDLGIQLPEIPEELEEFKITEYFDAIAKAVKGQPNWEVQRDDAVLWFFSFSKLLMYRDLDPENWPTVSPLHDRTLVRQLLREGFPSAQPLIEEDQNIDALFDPAQTLHVIDCDSSQALVIEEATRGRSLVIQGPPGTGKSQTITNLIAASIAAGRTILFVAEKMAALEVVKRRLDNIGLGEMVLELHSHKSNKRAVLQEIDRTLKQGTPLIPASAKETIEQVKLKRDELNQYVEILHKPFQASEKPASDPKVLAADKPTSLSGATGPTPYEILTELIYLRSQDTPLPDFQIPEATAWSQSEFNKKLTAVNDLAAVMNSIGEPQSHPWCGCNIESILPLDLERALGSAPDRIKELEGASESANKLAARVGVEAPTTLRQIEDLINTVEAFSKAPTLDNQAYQGPAWSDFRPRISEMADSARSIIKAQTKLKDVVTDSAWDKDIGDAVEDYSKNGQSLFRMFNSAYRSARNLLKQSLKGSQPAAFEDRLEILELLRDRQTGLKKLTEANVLGEKAFGRFWLGNQTEWQKIVEWEQWDRDAFAKGVHSKFRSLLSAFTPPDEFKALAQDASAKLATFAKSFQSLTSALQVDLKEAYAKWNSATDKNTESKTSNSPLGNAPFAPIEQIRGRLQSWRDQPEKFQQWQTYRRSMQEVAPIGNQVLTERIANGKIPANQVENVLRFARAEAILRETFKRNPTLEMFDGQKFEKLIEDFCKYDVERIELARAEIAKVHWDGIGRPRGDNIAAEVATLRHEMQKQRRHKPIRVLLRESGSAIQAVKPVFMMSPISVAQYLVPGGLEFDMLLIDEASQVRPVEALGAAARCKQIVVVGDDKQMPPTQFFGRTVGEIDDEDIPEMQAGDVESILSLAIAQNMPQRMLRWHYRSKHESLIAVSNREFYDNKLYVIPSPERFGELGVKLTFIENGKFLKGKNDVEAQRVAEAIMKHAKEKPKWTLGVAAFSVTQRDAIIDALEKLRKADNSCEAFFDPNTPDPFFIKNLENVQGDERDAIFVSVGYGPGEDGKVSLNFGPVSNSGGERRLNVLMTRAKSVLQIFTSMRAEDIDLSRATGKGPAVFREYLSYAQSRMVDAANQATSPTARPTAATSATRDQLGQVLKTELGKRGYAADTGIGLAGLFVDVAVIDPAKPGRYLLGFSLDGESYRSARSTRDRNRTSDGVLGAQGWMIHRIWSPEWFLKPKEQMDRLVEVIEAAKKGQLTRKPNRLANPVTQVERKTGGLDPLTLATGTPEKAPPKVTPIRPTNTASSSSASTSSPAKKSFFASFLGGCWIVLKFLGGVLVEILKLLTAGNKKSGSKKSTRRR